MWQVIPGQSLQFRAWDDEFVLYNDLSGDTHLLGASAIQLLLTLQRTPSDDGALCASLQLDQHEGLAGQVAELLADLQALSLIEPIEC
jgi:PqqD family protein of HPr-rel-A system